MVGQTGTSWCLDGAATRPVADLRRRVASLRHVFVRDEGYEEWLAAQTRLDPEVEVGADDWYVIRHSAGHHRASPRASGTPSTTGW